MGVRGLWLGENSSKGPACFQGEWISCVSAFNGILLSANPSYGHTFADLRSDPCVRGSSCNTELSSPNSRWQTEAGLRSWPQGAADRGLGQRPPCQLSFTAFQALALRQNPTPRSLPFLPGSPRRVFATNRSCSHGNLSLSTVPLGCIPKPSDSPSSGRLHNSAGI